MESGCLKVLAFGLSSRQKQEALGNLPSERDLMDENTDSLSSVVVLEQGAEWPQWIAEYQRRAPNSVVVAHSRGESMDDLSKRVARRVAELTGELRAGIVACAPTSDPRHLSVRDRICHTLLDAMGRGGGGEVILAASVNGSDGAKHAIFELAGGLCENLRGTRRVVRVRFSSGRPESGIMPSVASTERWPERSAPRPLPLAADGAPRLGRSNAT